MQSTSISPVQTTPNTPVYPSVTAPVAPIMPTDLFETSLAAPITQETKAKRLLILGEPATVNRKRIALA